MPPCSVLTTLAFPHHHPHTHSTHKAYQNIDCDKDLPRTPIILSALRTSPFNENSRRMVCSGFPHQDLDLPALKPVRILPALKPVRVHASVDLHQVEMEREF
ncbi:hypothetical protein RRG08_019637 [Elysia crispata]|uniref:Uncharacterized protein n=1 Tax=Elysia crispata TaxID=231223 RepID=A0AAE0ZSG5_9GAST|nr:hypothetical protein RRG08_019637 [Elysia crispata]